MRRYTIAFMKLLAAILITAGVLTALILGVLNACLVKLPVSIDLFGWFVIMLLFVAAKQLFKILK
jgi:hypothetical protein